MTLSGGTLTRSYAVDRQMLLQAVDQALVTLHMRAVSRTEDRIEATTGLSLFSTGSALLIALQDGDEQGKVALTITGRPKMKTVVVDYGQSTRDAKRIFQAVEEILGLAPVTSQGAVVGDPTAAASCAACGATLAPQDKFCGSCGTVVEQPVTADPTGAIGEAARATCSSCGAPVPQGAKFCQSCASRSPDYPVENGVKTSGLLH